MDGWMELTLFVVTFSDEIFPLMVDQCNCGGIIDLEFNLSLPCLKIKFNERRLQLTVIMN